MNVVSEQIRSMLERVLVLVHTPTRAIVATTLLPYMIMRGIINGSLRSLSDATAIITRISHWAVSTSKATDLSGVPLSFIILVSPLIEELTFRWGLSSEGNKSDSDDSRSLSRWVIVSSLLFSAVHIGNHLPVPSVDEVTLSFPPRKEIMKLSSELDKPTRESLISFMFGLHDYTLRYLPIISAMFQCQVAYVLERRLCGFWCSCCLECLCVHTSFANLPATVD